MADLAEFETAPEGTQRRPGPDADWTQAFVGDKLGEDHQSRNTQSKDYQVKIYTDAGVVFESLTTVTLTNVTGVAKYRNSSGNWVDTTAGGQYPVTAVGALSGSISVVYAGEGTYRPRPWS